MKLQEWLELRSIIATEFGRKMGKNGSIIHKYIDGVHLPGKEAMQQIYLLTDGMVTANDFYDLSHKLFQPVKLIPAAVPGFFPRDKKPNAFDWKGEIMTAFQKLELSGELGDESFEQKAASIHWLTGETANLKLACRVAGFEVEEIKEQAVRVLASQPGSKKKGQDIMN